MVWIASLALVGVLIQSPTTKAPKKAPKTTVAPSQTAMPAPVDWVRFAQLTIHEPGALALDPRIDAITSDARALIRALGEDGRQADQFLGAVKKAKPWPIELQAYMLPGVSRRMLIPVFYNEKNLDMVRAISDSDPKFAKRLETIEWGGERYELYASDPNSSANQAKLRNGRPVNYGCSIFGRFQGRSMLLFTSTDDPLESPADEAKFCLRELLRCNPVGREMPPSLASRLRGTGVELVLQTSELFDIFKNHPLQARFMSTAGGRLDGMVYRIECQEGKLVDEGFIDIRAGEGVLGLLLATADTPSTLRRWIPRKTGEFLYCRINLDNLAPSLAALRAVGVPTHPREWGNRFLWVRNALGAADPATVVQSNLTGEFAFLSTPSSVTEAAGDMTDAMGVFMLGTPNGAKILDWVKGFVADEGSSLGISMAPLKGDTEGVHILTMDRKPVCYVAARQDMIVFAEASKQNLTGVRSILATEGKAVLPDGFAERFGGDATNAPCTGMSLQHIFSRFAGVAALSQMLDGSTGSRLNSAVNLMERAFTGERGIFATRIVCTKEGLTFRSVW